jgi:hypothetical protein
MEYNELLDFVLKQLADLIFNIEEKRRKIKKRELEIIIKDGDGNTIQKFKH